MKENKIFIDNFYEQSLGLTLSATDNSKKLKVIVGFHPSLVKKIIKKETISTVMKALLLHDKIVITTSDVLKLVSNFGFEDTLALVKTNRFEFADDLGLTQSLQELRSKDYELSHLRFAHESEKVDNSLEWLEKKLSDKTTNDINLMNLILLQVEKQNILLNHDEIRRNLISETQLDISNSNIASALNLSTSSTKLVKKRDLYNVLRLSKLNKSLIYASEVNANNIAMDAAIQQILGTKISPILDIAPQVNLFDETFQDILNKKGVPDLTALYVKGVISIGDYLEIVESYSGKQFRNWIHDKDFDPATLEADILKSTPKINSKLVRFIKWHAPKVISLINPGAGYTTAVADSLIVDKLMAGWHPNLFLDEILKNRLDKKVALHEKQERLNSIKSKFPNTGRNDHCPCDSGKKFKRCCGK